MTSLGAGYAVTQSPIVKDVRELQQLKKQEKAQAAVTQTAQELETGGIPSEMATTVSPEQRKAVAQEELKSIQLAQAVNQQRLKMGLKRSGAAKTPAQAYSLNKQEQQQQELINRLQQRVDEKRGVKNAVPERKDLLSQLREMGVNVENPAIRIHNVDEDREEGEQY